MIYVAVYLEFLETEVLEFIGAGKKMTFKL